MTAAIRLTNLAYNVRGEVNKLLSFKEVVELGIKPIQLVKISINVVQNRVVLKITTSVFS